MAIKLLILVSIILVANCVNQGLIGVRKSADKVVSSFINSINEYTSAQFLKDIKTSFRPVDYTEDDVSFVDFKVDSVVFNAFGLTGTYAYPITTLEGGSTCYNFYLSFTVKKTGDVDRKIQVMLTTSSIQIFIQYSHSETKNKYTESISKVIAKFFAPDNQSYSAKYYSLPSGVQAYFRNYLETRFNNLAGLELSDYFNQSRLQKDNILALNYNSIIEHRIILNSNIIDLYLDDSSIILYLDGSITNPPNIVIKPVGFDNSVFKDDSANQHFVDFGLINGALDAISEINNKSFFYSFFNFITGQEIQKCGEFKFEASDIFDFSCFQLSHQAAPSPSKSQLSVTLEMTCLIIDRSGNVRNLITKFDDVQLITSFDSVIEKEGFNFKLSGINISDGFTISNQISLDDSCVREIVLAKYQQFLNATNFGTSYKALTRDIKTFGFDQLDSIEFSSKGLLIVSK